jgi:hypothetical protein
MTCGNKYVHIGYTLTVRHTRREQGGTQMTDMADRDAGEKRSLFCPDCGEEQTFIQTVWSGEEFFGYPPGEEAGWKCSVCGCRLRDG